MPRLAVTFATSSSMKYISQKQVVPLASISSMAISVPRAISAGVNSASRGKMWLKSQSWRDKSSATPRRRVMGTWVCALTKPGRTMAFWASKVVVCSGKAVERGTSLPTKRIMPSTIRI